MGWQCFSDPAPTAKLGEACDLGGGPGCEDGLRCDQFLGQCVKLCCPEAAAGTLHACEEGEKCVEMATNALWLCRKDNGPGGSCYDGHGTCTPGAGDCGVNGQCDWGNSSIGMQCFSNPPATALLGETCNLGTGPACKDGLACTKLSGPGQCVEICCDQTDCTTGTCQAVDGIFKVCL